MPERLLLIADQESLELLQECGELPRDFFVQPEYSELLGWHTSPENSFAVLPAELLTPCHGSAAPPSRDLQRQQLVQWIVEGLGDVVLCVLARHRRQTLNPASAASSSTSPAAETSPSAPSAAGFLDAAQLFQDLAERLAHSSQIRSARVQAVLLAIFERPAAEAELQAFREAVGPSADAAGNAPEKLIRLGYVLGPFLEAGLERAQVFYAEHVWPLAVSGLAAALSLKPAAAEEGVRSGSVFAWRAVQLQAEILQTRLKHATRFTAREVLRLLENRAAADGDSGEQSDPAVDPGLLERIPEQYDPIERLRLPQHLLDAGWLSDQVGAAGREVSSGQRWEQSLTRAGRTDALERARLILTHEHPDDQHIRRGWSEVCRNPGMAGRLLNERRGGFSEPLQAATEARFDQWRDLQQRDRELAAAGQDFDDCCQALQLAGHGFAGPGRRLLAAIAVICALSFFFWQAGWQIFPGYSTPLLLSLAAAAGTFLAAGLTGWLEELAGQRGLEQLRASRRRLDELQEERHYWAESSVRAAEKLRRQRLVVLQDARDRWLLSRVSVALGALSEQRAAEAAGGTQTLAAAGTVALGSEQRRLLRSILQRRQLFHTMPSEAVAEQQLQRVCRQLVDDFLEQHWRPFAMQSAAGLRGWLPGPRLRLLFEQLRSRLLLAVQQELQRQAVSAEAECLAVGSPPPESSDSGENTPETWVAAVQKLQAAPFLQALSCRQDPAVLADAILQPPPVLLLEESVLRLSSRFPDSALLCPVTAKRGAGLPFAGLWFQQLLLRPERLALVLAEPAFAHTSTPAGPSSAGGAA